MNELHKVANGGTRGEIMIEVKPKYVVMALLFVIRIVSFTFLLVVRHLALLFLLRRPSFLLFFLDPLLLFLFFHLLLPLLLRLFHLDTFILLFNLLESIDRIAWVNLVGRCEYRTVGESGGTTNQTEVKVEDG